MVSNCVLNLVHPEDRSELWAEIHRVLRRGGRAVISDIVSDEDVPVHLQRDGELWSGCVAGAIREDLRSLGLTPDEGVPPAVERDGEPDELF